KLNNTTSPNQFSSDDPTTLNITTSNTTSHQNIHITLSIVDSKPNQIMTEEEEDEQEEEPEKINFDNEQDLNEILNKARDEEMQQLSQFITDQKPIDDEVAQVMISQLDLTLNQMKARTLINVNDNNKDQQQILTSPSIITVITTQHSYPPMNQTGQIKDHDRPYAKYEEFGIENIQYICIGEEISELNHQQHLHIQIIFKETIDRRKPFLDDTTQTHCNYQVTRNDLAWNEYIKKDGNCIEFNEFKSTTTRGSKQWPSLSSSPSSRSPRSRSPSTSSTRTTSPVTTTTMNLPPAPAPPPHPSVVPKATTAKAQAEEKRQHQLEIYKQAIKLAENNVDHAMDLIKQEMIGKFVERGSWYLAIFNYVHLRAQREGDQRGEIDKDYIWPHSFPHCTPQLREAMNCWIKEEFNRSSRAKCLIIIGPTSTGKTSFAMSLPGRVNYFQERWNLDAWNNYARYSVYDDIPWDDFNKLNFPNKKNLLTQKKYKISVSF
ncbi:unnamed protein product, partial [Rotaria sordida]